MYSGCQRYCLLYVDGAVQEDCCVVRSGEVRCMEREGEWMSCRFVMLQVVRMTMCLMCMWEQGGACDVG